MNQTQKQKCVFLFIVALAISAFLPLAVATNDMGENDFFMWGYPSGFTQDYTFNKTQVYPYSYNQTYVGGLIDINSGYGSYDLYSNISYTNGTLFNGLYSVWVGWQTNDLSLAIQFDKRQLFYSDIIDETVTYSSGFSGPADTDVYTFGTILPEASTQDSPPASTYLPVTVEFMNSTLGIDFEVHFLFVCDEFNGTFEIISPTITPPPFNFDLGSSTFGDLASNWVNLIVYAIGLFLSMIGIVVLMKQPGAWMPALIFFVVGFFACLASWLSLYSLVGWSVMVIVSFVMFYGSTKQKIAVER